MDESIKLPGSSFEEVAKIIQAYAAANRAVSLEEVSKRIGMHTTIVSRNNGFLLSIGILEGGKNKAVTTIGKNLGDALGHNLEEEVKRILQQIVDGSEFLKNVVGAVRIRRGMDEVSLPLATATDPPVPSGVVESTHKRMLVESYLSTAATSRISLQIQVRVECTPDQLDGLGSRLRSVIAEFEAAAAAEQTPSDDE